MGVFFVSFCCTLFYVYSSLAEERESFMAWYVFLVSSDGCVTLPRGAMGLSAACDSGIS